MAKCSLEHGVKILRLEGVESINKVQSETGAKAIGLIKRHYPGTSTYITPTLKEVDDLLQTDCEIIALDARKVDEGFVQRVQKCHESGRLVLADIEADPKQALLAQEAGVDFISTTFGQESPGCETAAQPDFVGLSECMKVCEIPVLLEGLVATEAHIQRALMMGVAGIVVGGALNDPVKTTKRFVRTTRGFHNRVGAVDLGGTWQRFAVLNPDGNLSDIKFEPLAQSHEQRLAWIKARCIEAEVEYCGISTGGDVDPKLSRVYETKEIIPDNSRAKFELENMTLRVLNDGLAVAWGHLAFALKKGFPLSSSPVTVSLAIGTGLGCGITIGTQILNPSQYPRLNDLHFRNGRTFEQALGGSYLGENPGENQKELAIDALKAAVEMLDQILHPDLLFLSGGVTQASWIKPAIVELTSKCNGRLILSPLGDQAGLYGAGCLAQNPPLGVFDR